MPLKEAAPSGDGSESVSFPEPQTIYGKKGIILNGQPAYVHETGALGKNIKRYLRNDPNFDVGSKRLLDIFAEKEPHAFELARYVVEHPDLRAEITDFVHSNTFEILAWMSFRDGLNIDPNRLVEHPTQP